VIKNNTADIHSYFDDLNEWKKEMTGADAKLKKGMIDSVPKAVRLFYF